MKEPLGQDSGTADSAANPKIISEIPAHTYQEKHFDTGQAPKNENRHEQSGPQKSYWERLKDEKPDRHIELLLTFAITFFAAVQLISSCNNNVSTTNQTKKLIDAANISSIAAQQNAKASQSFADSAHGINRGVSDAAKRLQSQTDATEAARETSERNSEAALQATIDNFHREQRAWVGLCGVDLTQFEAGKPIHAEIRFCNTGKTPGQHVQKSLRFGLSTSPADEPPPSEVAQLSYAPAMDILPGIGFTMTGGGPAPAETSGAAIAGQEKLDRAFVPIRTGTTLLYYYGVIKYDDVFGKHHHTRFCVLLNDPKTKQMGYCRKFNDMD